MSKKLQCQECGRAEYGEDLYNYDGAILCRYCIVARVYNGFTPCEYVGTCNDKTFPNKADQIDQLKQQLEESFTEEDVEGLIEDRDKTIKFLQQQLAEKDKEIESLKQQLEEINAGYDFTYEQSRETIKELKQNQTQLAIQELEKLMDKVIESSEKIVDTVECIQDFHSGITLGRFKRIIDQQINELREGK